MEIFCLKGMFAWLEMVQAFNLIGQRAAAQLTEYELTPAQFDVLAQLSEEQGIMQQELAEKLLVSKGNITGLINRLEARGLVVRRQNPEDARSHCLHLTDAGEVLAASVIPAHEALIGDLMSALSENEQTLLCDWMKKIQEKAK